MDQNNVVYFNNCKNFNHEASYGSGAFFDLSTKEKHKKLAVNLPIGQVCVVASLADDGDICFDWHVLHEEKIVPLENGNKNRVFFGEQIVQELLTKANAAENLRYSAFFNINGHFKRPSVIKSSVPHKHIPKILANNAGLSPDEIDLTSGTFVEGTTRQITVNAIERSVRARTACLEKHGTSCCICDFDFGKVYGEEVAGYIQVHHLKPLSEIKASYEVDPIEDLRPVCPNCHAVIHHGGKNRSIGDVKKMISGRPDWAG